MKKIILATTLSALFASSAFAGVANGDIDFEGTVTNPPCEVTLEGADNFTVTLDSVEVTKFEGKTNEVLRDVKKPFTLVAQGAGCEQATLKLTPAKPHDSITGVFYGADAANNSLAFYLEQNNAPVNFNATAPLAPTATDATASWSKFSFASFYYADGNVPVPGSYKAKIAYTVTNP